MIREATINQATIQSTKSTYDKGSGGLAAIITIKAHIPPGEIAKLLDLQPAPVHLIIKSYQAELSLDEPPNEK